MKKISFLIFVIFVSRLESLPIEDSSSKKPETVTKPFPKKVAIGLYSSQFLDLLLQMKIFPKVEHWPLADGRTISGTFYDETIFHGIIHSPNDPGVPDVKGKFTNLQPLGKVTLTLNGEEII